MRERSNSSSRNISITPATNPYAEGSVDVRFGNTHLTVTASVSDEVPKWLKGPNGEIDKGWITAEYGMLPRSTHTRNKRESAAGKQGGRTLEIQRLIGRAMRASIDQKDIAGILVTLDCDVIVADGGTRTAAINGAWVALCHALHNFSTAKKMNKRFKVKGISAISAGSVNGELLVDLCYEEDSNAEFDCNFVINSDFELVEIQGTAEKKALKIQEIQKLLELSTPTLNQIFELQKKCCSELSTISIC